MTLAVAEVLTPNKPNLDMTLAVAEVLTPNKPSPRNSWNPSMLSTSQNLIMHDA